MKLSSTLLFCFVAGLALTVDASLYEVKQKAEEVVSELRGLLRGESTKVVKKPEESGDSVGKKPWFCHDLDCPEYSVVNKTKNYELRKYTASRWVSTMLEGVDYDKATETMFMKLFEYIEGNNEKKEKIAMTAPVTVRAMPGQGPACVNNFTMSFYMSPKVTDPPAPAEKDVFLSSLPELNVYVSSFGGREHQDWLKHADALAAVLTKEKKKFDRDYFYTAGYDSPFRLIFRHNEIWFVAN